MKEIKECGLCLLQMQNIVALIVITAYGVLVCRGKVDIESVNNVTLMIIGFLFGNRQQTGGTKV